MHITASEFLKTLYPESAPGAVCIARRADGKFSHHRVETGLEPPGETYVCVSTVLDAARMRRRKDDCVTACVVMLDDIGTKVGAPPVEPTAVLETSEGNYQYVYRIEPWSLDDGGTYAALLSRLADKGYTDAGAGGVNRVYRVPGSLNVKRSPAWETRVTEWHPERVWRLGELAEAFELSAEAPAPAPDAGGVVPDGPDEVLTWLEDGGQTHSRHDEWHVITCPWGSTHSNDDDTAAYSPIGAGSKPYLRGFRCLHAHCANRTITHFLAWVADQGGPSVAPTAPTEDIGALLRDVETRGLTVDERYQLVRSSFPEVHGQNLPDARVNKEGFPTAQQLVTSDNVAYVVDACGVDMRFNVMTRDPEFTLRDESVQRIAPNEHAISRGVMDTCTRLGMTNTKEVKTIMVERALSARYHPMQAWIESRAWDGESRLAELAGTAHVAQDEHALWPVFLRKWLIQGVQAVCGWVEPKQVGSVLVFSGRQYIGKTRWFGSLVPTEFFTPSARLALSFNAKDSIMSVTKTPVTELGELDSTFKKSDTGALKAFLTSEIDTYRPPYTGITLRLPRATVFCATVNRIDFLMDETGARRFWPVEVESCTPDHGIDMQQVWAEAHALWSGGEEWWLSQAEARRQEDHSAYYKVGSEVEDMWNDYLARTAGQDTQHYMVGNISDIASRLGADRSPQNLGTLRRLLTEHFGRRRAKIEGTQNAWRIPDPMKVVLK